MEALFRVGYRMGLGWLKHRFEGHREQRESRRQLVRTCESGLGQWCGEIGCRHWIKSGEVRWSSVTMVHRTGHAGKIDIVPVTG